MMTIIRRACFSFFLAAFVILTIDESVCAQTQEPVIPVERFSAEDIAKLLHIRLLAQRETIQPGETIWIGIEHAIAPGWHTYWLNPGDSGSATRISWQLPEGFQIGAINWPVPQKIPYGPLLNYGYSEQVILLQPLTSPEALPEGPLSLRANIDALVCKDECIPVSHSLDLVLNGDNDGLGNNELLQKALARLPLQTAWDVSYFQSGPDFVLNFPAQAVQEIGAAQDISFIPADWGLISNPAAAKVEKTETGLRIMQPRGERDLAEVKTITGLLAMKNARGVLTGYEFQANPDPSAPPVTMPPLAQDTQPKAQPLLSLSMAFFYALIGGLILNLMPCVFPVLSLKALSIVKNAHHNAATARYHGMVYTAGVLVSFWLIAGALIALQSAGAQIGWGFQLQHPAVIALLAALMFLVGLNLAGFFELTVMAGHGLSRWIAGHGLGASFFTGVLAVLVATPCTAPFMAAALGYAALQPPHASLMIFTGLGLGLALPYLAICFIPALQKTLPKPGPWMEIFRQALAFPMFGFAAWLVWVLAQQGGSFAVLSALLGLIALTLGIWLLKHHARVAKLLSLMAFALGFCLLLATGWMGATAAPQPDFGQRFSPAVLEEALQSPDPVFVEMTAAWCITCKFNHATSINIESTRALFAEKKVRYLVGDWTNADPQITEFLRGYGRNGVPLYIVYGQPDPATGTRPEPVVLPQILTPGIVANAVE
ncbi:MAG: thioredoxin family protein [Alphaproteobacteria bacterium]|nr:thioredoxin family protein [Alphaproteobacteria bacterium]